MQNQTVNLELKARTLPYLVGLLVLIQILFPSKGWMLLLIGIGGAWLAAYLWGRSLSRGLDLDREMRYGWTQVGDRIQERFTLSNSGWAPAPWVEILDGSDLPGYQASRVLPLGERALVHWFNAGTCQRRGVYTLGPTRVRSSDPFGIYMVTLDYPSSHTMMVLPPVVDLPSIEVAPGGRAGEGRYSTEFLERSTDARGVREYGPGDAFRQIHWPTSARREALFVRLFDSTPSSDLWIVLDANTSVQAGEDQMSTMEHGVILAASLADRALQMGSAVGLASHGHELVWLPPQCSADRRWSILRCLALLKPGRRSLSELLERARFRARRNAAIVVITPDVEGRWLRPLKALLRQGVVPTVLMLDRASFGGEGDPAGAMASLFALGVRHHRISADLLDRPEVRPGQTGQWRRTPQGRWEPQFDRRKLAWRTLT